MKGGVPNRAAEDWHERAEIRNRIDSLTASVCNMGIHHHLNVEMMPFVDNLYTCHKISFFL
jgi:hypothetical protein